WVVSAVLLGLTAARLYYTTHLPAFDPLNQGVDFYDPIVAELLFSSILTLFWATWVIHVVVRNFEWGLAVSFASELLGLSVVFVLWLVGAAIATNMWGDLHWCWIYQPCRLLTALVAFAWIGWITILVLLVLSTLFVTVNRALYAPLHGRYDFRSHFRNAGRTVRV
ncbi:hypothetical protein BKA93DRAFT_727798, partial [Sparassis latifolia]